MFNPKRSARFDHLSLLSLLGSASQKNLSRHNRSILLSKLSSALFGVMGTDSVLACGITDRLAVARTFFKTPAEKWRPALSIPFFTMYTKGKLGRGDKRLLVAIRGPFFAADGHFRDLYRAQRDKSQAHLLR